MMKETSPISRDPEIKKEVIEVIKILKELRKAISRNADHCNKEIETRSPYLHSSVFPSCENWRGWHHGFLGVPSSSMSLWERIYALSPHFIPTFQLPQLKLYGKPNTGGWGSNIIPTSLPQCYTIIPLSSYFHKKNHKNAILMENSESINYFIVYFVKWVPESPQTSQSLNLSNQRFPKLSH